MPLGRIRSPVSYMCALLGTRVLRVLCTRESFTNGSFQAQQYIHIVIAVNKVLFDDVRKILRLAKNICVD